MVTYSFYESDSRVIQYARALVQRGETVDVMALRRPSSARFDVLDGVNVFRIQDRKINESGPLSYLYRICRFLLLSTFLLTLKHVKHHYTLVHVHSVPDFLVFSALPARILGARVILDIHDILPEFYASKFGTKTDSLFYGMLLTVERLSARMANHVIVANHLWHENLIHRATTSGKCSVICNYPNPEIFHRPKKVARNGHFVLMYPGTLNWHQGVDVAIRGFASVKDEMPDAIFRIFGEGPEKARLSALIQELHLEDRVTISDYLPIKQIANEMANADLAVVPKRASSSFGTEAASTKVFEFLALGVPVIVSRTRIDSSYFNDSTVKFFESENVDDLAQCMLQLAHDPLLRSQFAKNGLEYTRQNNWDVKQQDYLRLVDSMVERNARARRAPSSNSAEREVRNA